MSRVALFAFVAVAACTSSEDASVEKFGRASSSIAVLAGGDRLAVVDADRGSVSVLDAATLEVQRSIDVGGEPHALLELASGVVLVTTQRGGEVVAIDPTSGEVRARRHVCAGPYGLAEPEDRTWVAVACEWDGRVVRVDETTLDAVEIASGLARPRAIAASNEAVYVAGFVGGQLSRIAANVTATPLVPKTAPYRPAVTAMTPNLATAITPAFDRVYVAHELVNHTGETSLERVADDYGSVTDGNPKINPAVTEIGLSGGVPAPTSAPVLYAKFDGGSRVFNGPSALAAFGARFLLVAHESTANVAVLDVNAADPETRVRATLAVGSGPRGIAVDESRGLAYIDNAFDASVTTIDLKRFESILTRRRDLSQPFSAKALAGRKIFHDAANPHVTPSGVVACSTCHPGGGDDGLVWFMHTDRIPMKRRRTPHLANARSTTAPFHWDGQFPSISQLVQGTVRDLMAGDGLLVDGDAVQAYIDEIVRAPLAPVVDRAAAERGRAAFEGQGGCASCHSGPDFTDNLAHTVFDLDASTPGLHGVFLRAPYFHDGRAPTLDDVLVEHGDAGVLSPGERADLLVYLRSL